ncbi:MAG TPA: hypothetical protein VGK24_02660 [Candidatus Angelobacter sp.]|jgi:hypothetical protein
MFCRFCRGHKWPLFHHRAEGASNEILAGAAVAKGQWQNQSVEVEVYSRNFAANGHDPKKCNVIVCWEHNWPECPVEIVELSKEEERIGIG